MDCPVCKNVNLTMSDRQGIEIDYCPSCRGVWLDRGELDKLIERSTSSSSPPAPQALPNSSQYAPSSERHTQHSHYKKKKKGSFLGELFDFD